MTATALIEQGQEWLEAHYDGYKTFPTRERRVLAAAWLCDAVKPRELSGRNDGAVVEAILANVGLPAGNPWCAAAQALIADVAKVLRPSRDEAPASVAGWRRWARKIKLDIPIKLIRRGDLVTKDYGGGKGHIGIVVKRIGPLIWTIEGNTGPGEVGSQRDGDGLYRRTRPAWFWSDAISG